uniref:Uncharacterized protein n=1 Tax=Anguilla anguilla TaxID=7936 RepID=A0A0E9UI62_ANGAN
MQYVKRVKLYMSWLLDHKCATSEGDMQNWTGEVWSSEHRGTAEESFGSLKSTLAFL